MPLLTKKVESTKMKNSNPRKRQRSEQGKIRIQWGFSGSSVVSMAVFGLVAICTGEAREQSLIRQSYHIDKEYPSAFRYSEPSLSPALMPNMPYSGSHYSDPNHSLDMDKWVWHHEDQSSRILQTEQQCSLALVIRNTDRDDMITEDEFVGVINQLTSSAYLGVAFDALPCSLQATFTLYADSTTNAIDVTGTKPGETPSEEQSQHISALCTDIIAFVTGTADADEGCIVAPAAAPPGAPSSEIDCSDTIETAQCNTALSIADLSRDNFLDQSEYVRFVNRLSSDYSDASYDDLPGNIQSNFEKFAVDGTIDITGSKPGVAPTAEQEAFLASLCCETDLAVRDPGQPVEAPTAAPASTPTGGGIDCSDTIPQQQCDTALAIADLSRDDLMDESEYVRFINRLSDNAYTGFEYTSLPANLQTNFIKFAVTNGQVDLTGSKPGQTPTAEQAVFLAALCCETDLATDDPGEPVTSPPVAPSGPTTAAPADAPSIAPASTPTNGEIDCSETIGEAQCSTALTIADLSRDDLMDEAEYVRFVNRLSNSEYADSNFTQLPTNLQVNFVKFATTNGQVDLTGSKAGQTPTEEQSTFLAALCCETDLAVANPSTPSEPTAPTAAPPTDVPPTGTPPTTSPPSPTTSPPPTLPPGLAEVFSSFVIANSRSQTAADLQTGANREGLNLAYAAFASEAVIEVPAVKRRLKVSNMRGRRLAVTYVTGSDDIYLLLDDDCPEGTSTTEICQTVFAKFQVSLDDEDPDQISEQYTASSQDLIADGLLQEKLTELDPRSTLRIVGASFPVSSTFPPTAAPIAPEPTAVPTVADNGNGSGDGGGGGANIGAIVGGILGGILFCAGIGWASTKFGGGRGKVTDDDDNFGGGKDDDASEGEKENGFGADGDRDDSGKGSVGDDNVFGEKEQSQQDTKNMFGFGKKNRQGSDKGENAFGLDATDANDAFGNDGDDNLELFNFDDPSVVRESQGVQHSSPAGKSAFGGNNSAGWGNSGGDGGANGGGFFGTDGGGWGATENGGSGADNFFANSTFGAEASKGEESGSGSRSEEGSYTSSEDSTYQSDNVDEEEDEPDSASGSRSSDDDGSSDESGSMSSGLRRKSEQLDDMIEDGNWDGIAAAANSFNDAGGSSLEDSSKRSSGRDKSLTEESEVDENEEEDEESQSESEGSGSVSESTATSRTEDREKRAEFRAQVEALVRLVLPDEVEKVDAMMEQFKGREAELVSTLQTMQERSATQRARAAVHKSKNRPQRDARVDGAFSLASGGGAEGAAAGTAAIAAASLPIPADGMFADGAGDFGSAGFGDQGAFGGSGEMEGSFEEGTGSYDEEGSRSHSGSGSRSYYSDEGSYTDEGSRTEGSRTEGSRTEGSRTEGSRTEGSRTEGSGHSGSRSYYSDEGSQSRSHTGEGSRSQFSGEGSRSHSGEGSRSQYSGEGSRSQYSGEGSRSYISGEESGSRSRSRRSGDDDGSRSQYSDEEGSRSQYSGEEGSRSQYSGEEGSRSYYSGEEGSRGSRSYYSGEEEGSYYSGEEGSHTEGEE